MAELFQQVEAAILEAVPSAKCEGAAALYRGWQKGELSTDPGSPILPIDDPVVQPEAACLVPAQVAGPAIPVTEDDAL